MLLRAERTARENVRVTDFPETKRYRHVSFRLPASSELSCSFLLTTKNLIMTIIICLVVVCVHGENFVVKIATKF